MYVYIYIHILTMYMCIFYMYMYIYIHTLNQIISKYPYTSLYIYISYTSMYSHGSHLWISFAHQETPQVGILFGHFATTGDGLHVRHLQGQFSPRGKDRNAVDHGPLDNCHMDGSFH